MIRALNPIKLARAIAECGQNASEDAIKAVYLRLGGKLEGEEQAPVVAHRVEVEQSIDAEEPVVTPEPPKQKVKKPITRILRKK